VLNDRDVCHILVVRDPGKERLSGEERRLVWLLGVPSAGLSLALTVLAAYLPLLAHRFTSSRAVIGGLVGGEGLVAVFLPPWIGGLSDRVESRFGRRLPFLVATAPAAAIALVLIPSASSLPLMALEVFFFYLAYFTYLAPYRALYLDLVPQRASGRALGIQGILNAAGLGAALVGGGLLFELWRPLPYLVAAAALLLSTVVLVLGLSRLAGRAAEPERSPRSLPEEIVALLRDHRSLRLFVVGNALLALAMGGLKTFVVLWLTHGLGKSMSFTAAMMAVVGAGAAAGALVTGKLADRYGTLRVLSLSLSVFGLGLLLPAFSSSLLLLGAVFPLIAFSGGAALVLPYALLMQMRFERSHGALAGLYDVSGGLGTLLGPAITGVAIDLLHPLFASTHGYAAMWPVLGVSTLTGIAVLRRAQR
jgi:MFS family permease